MTEFKRSPEAGFSEHYCAHILGLCTLPFWHQGHCENIDNLTEIEKQELSKKLKAIISMPEETWPIKISEEELDKYSKMKLEDLKEKNIEYLDFDLKSKDSQNLQCYIWNGYYWIPIDSYRL